MNLRKFFRLNRNRWHWDEHRLPTNEYIECRHSSEQKCRQEEYNNLQILLQVYAQYRFLHSDQHGNILYRVQEEEIAQSNILEKKKNDYLSISKEFEGSPK